MPEKGLSEKDADQLLALLVDQVRGICCLQVTIIYQVKLTSKLSSAIFKKINDSFTFFLTASHNVNRTVSELNKPYIILLSYSLFELFLSSFQVLTLYMGSVSIYK